MNSKQASTLAEEIIQGQTPGPEQYQALWQTPEKDTLQLLAGAELIREHFCGREVHLCTILNGKSGKCSEDCTFCAQSAFAKTDAPVYPLLAKDKLTAPGHRAASTPINRYSIVTTGKRLPKKEVQTVAEALAELKHDNIETCASLGTLEEEDFRVLKAAGVTRYHHNLETAESHYPAICRTHPFSERVATIRAAQKAGLSICAGGIFGIGESDAQILEMALTIKDLDVDAVPLNFLTPVPGTPLAGRRNLTPLKCLKIIALFRYVLPQKEILICGGRELNLGSLHPLVFQAGASGIMTGNYLTTTGRTLAADLTLLAELQMQPRQKH